MTTQRIQKSGIYINSRDGNSIRQLGNGFFNCLSEIYDGKSPIVVLCIGTDRATGDSLGPLTGTSLSKHSYKNVKLFGTLDCPVHALNLKETLVKIHSLCENPFIVAVDASLGTSEKIGYLRLDRGSLEPGLSLNKKLPPVGNMHITGVVNFSGMMEMLILQTTKLSTVIKMSEVISGGIRFGLSKLAFGIG